MTDPTAPAQPLDENSYGGFTKKEVVMKDFMAALISGLSNLAGAAALFKASEKTGLSDSEVVATMAREYTDAYFAELNKKQNE